MNRILLFFIFQLGFFPSFSQQWNYINRDSTDIARYQEILKSRGIHIDGYSAWEHAFASERHHENFSFITGTKDMGIYQKSKNKAGNGIFQYGRGDWQLAMLGLDSFHKLGFTGKGITIALMDGGFYRVDSLSAFDSIRAKGQIKGTFDAVTGDSSVYEDDSHGMAVLSTIAGNISDSLVGAAPDANFLLIRTEDVATETHKEEFYWIKGMEIAHQHGADIIHSSLGYSVFDTLEGDYSYFDMDGKSTFITRATDSAFARGMFVNNSAGNEGEKKWRYITAPCDGKYVLCVGAVDSFRQKAGFSSFGPSADGRVKPEVMAMGHKTTIIGSDGYVRTGSGTSFSGPIMAGFVACLKQAHPTAENYRIYQAIIRSADRYENPDSAYGYGIPNILRADSILKRMASEKSPRKATMAVYPNPGNDYVSISGISTPVTLRWVTPEGKLASEITLENQRDLEHLSTENLAMGIYFLFVDSVEGRLNQKWIKVHP